MIEEDVSIEPSSLCKPQKMGYVFFPEKRNITATIDICNKLKGWVPVVKSKKIQNELSDLFMNHFETPESSYGMNDITLSANKPFFLQLVRSILGRLLGRVYWRPI